MLTVNNTKMPRAKNPEIVKGLLCFGRVVIDPNCNLSAPTGTFDNGIKVDIGGNVDMMATTVDFRNATIDFDGATLENFTGNISGNISGNLNVDLVNAIVVNADKINGNLCGNVVANFMQADLYTGCVCGDIQTSTIIEKTTNSGINVTGNLNAQTVGTHYGPVFGDVCGDIVTDNISPKTMSGVTVTGQTIFVNDVQASANVNLTDSTRFFVGNLCGDVFTPAIHPKTQNGNIDLTTGNIIVSDVVGGNFFGSFFGNLIGNIFPLDTVGNFSGNFVGNSFGKFTGNVCGNVINGNIINGNTINCNIVITPELQSNLVCGNTIQTDCIETKSMSSISVKENISFSQMATFIGNVSAANVLISQNLVTPSGSIITGDICGNIITDRVTSKTGNSINIIANSGVILSGSLTATTFIGNLQGNFNGNVNGNVIGKLFGNVCGNIEPPVGGSEVNVNGDLCIDGTSLKIGSTQVLTVQQPAVSDAAGPTSSSLSLSVIGNTLASDQSTNINNNFTDIENEFNDLLTDVSNIRSQLNTLLARLRTHELIDT